MTANKSGVVLITNNLNNNVSNRVLGFFPDSTESLSFTIGAGVDMWMTVDDLEVKPSMFFYRKDLPGPDAMDEWYESTEVTGGIDLEHWPYFEVKHDFNGNDVVPHRYYFEDVDDGISGVFAGSVFNRKWSSNGTQYRFPVWVKTDSKVTPGLYKGFLYIVNNVGTCGYLTFSFEIKDVNKIIPDDPKIAWFHYKETP